MSTSSEIGFSEFSYGYALTTQLVSVLGGRSLGPPEFLSTYKEGKPGGGWDVRVGPVFLQFKIPQYLWKKHCKRKEKILPPSFRMFLHQNNNWRQHDLLRALEAHHRVVRYASPCFHSQEEFEDAYARMTIAQRSIFVRPSLLSTPTDLDDHYVAYSTASPGWSYCSEPEEHGEPIDGTTFLKELGALRDAPERQVDAVLREVDADLFTLIRERIPGEESRLVGYQGIPNVIKRVVLLSAVYLDCHVLML